jgi:hypothetical protein
MMVEFGYVLLAPSFLIALGTFVALDIVAAASAHRRFVAIYAAFWVLIGIILLHGTPLSHKLPILALFAATVFAVRLVKWNGRKPFLRDLYRIQEGMTQTQVDQIMGGHRKGTSPGAEFGERGDIQMGTVRYWPTDETERTADVAMLTFENGRVVQIDFLPAQAGG